MQCWGDAFKRCVVGLTFFTSSVEFLFTPPNGDTSSSSRSTARPHTACHPPLDDTLQICMALEEEFCITIPDAEAEKILSVEDAINFIATHPQAK